MTPIPIATARALGEKHGARRLVVIALGAHDYAITTWGKTKRDCRALAAWADSPAGTALVAELEEADETK